MKKNQILLLAAFAFPFNTTIEAQNITTIIGDGVAGFSGNGGQATLAEVNGPNDPVYYHGSIYFVDQRNSYIRKVDPSGIISNVAGTGTNGFGGDGGPAISATFNQPTIITFDSSQNMYIADFGNNRIRKIDEPGTITTFAGRGLYSYSGDGEAATLACLAGPCHVIADDSGNIYIADSWNNVIRKVDTSGIIHPFAGNHTAGFGGDGGPATSAELYCPFRIQFDRNWNMYIADCFNSRIRKISVSGVITTIAGSGVQGYAGDNGPAVNAELNRPYGVCLDIAGNVYIADSYNNVIRKVDVSTNIITTIAGTGTAGYFGDGGPAITAELDFPCELQSDQYNRIYIGDYDNNRIRIFTLPKLGEGINEVSNNNNFLIYPNPAKDELTIQITGTVKAETLSIYSITGQEVKKLTIKDIASTNIPISISNLAEGAYFIKANMLDGSMVVKKVEIIK